MIHLKKSLTSVRQIWNVLEITLHMNAEVLQALGRYAINVYLSVACSSVFTVGFYLKTDTNCCVYKFHAKRCTVYINM